MLTSRKALSELVDVDHENVSGRRRPVEKLSLVDVDQLKTSVENVVDGRRSRADVFITPYILAYKTKNFGQNLKLFFTI